MKIQRKEAVIKTVLIRCVQGTSDSVNDIIR